MGLGRCSFASPWEVRPALYPATVCTVEEQDAASPRLSSCFVSQHRMRPEIAQLLCPHIYPALENHPSVLLYNDIKVSSQ